MAFLHSWALAGLVAAGIPLLLHLLQRQNPPTVIFPAVRYLVVTTEQQQRRLKLQHWLLLLVRTLLIVALVLAAAGPSLPARGPVGGHAPAALVLVLDNSLSSGVLTGGTPLLAALERAGREVLSRATPGDQLWLITADNLPRAGDRDRLLAALDSLEPLPRRLDLGEAITAADGLLNAATLPGEIVVVTDLQASAVSPAAPRAPVTVLHAEDPPPRNVGIARIDAGSQPWPLDGGRVTVALAGDSGQGQVTVALGTRPPRQALAGPGHPAAVSLGGVPPGWWTVRAALDPDELRADDVRELGVRVAPLAAVRWDSTDRYVGAAMDVLARNGRVRRGDEVSFDRLGPGVSIVLPPGDPAALGALNRALAARGSGWRFGELTSASGVTDSGAVLGRIAVRRRRALEYAASRSGASAAQHAGVLVTVGGEPWLVRSGSLVLIGSRLDPAWTDLPVSAAFVPFLDRLVNRIARGELAVVDAAVGEPELLPDFVTEVRRGDQRWPVEGGAAFRAPQAGVFYLLAERDTVGVLAAGADPRESVLERMAPAAVERLWRGARVRPLDEAGAAAFAGLARVDLRGPLLWLALLLGVAEVALASAVRGDKREAER